MPGGRIFSNGSNAPDFRDLSTRAFISAVANRAGFRSPESGVQSPESGVRSLVSGIGSRKPKSTDSGLRTPDFLFVPVFVKRPARAAQARRPAPLMRAGRAAPARFERVPKRSAAAVKKFRLAAVGAKPAARARRLPFTERAADFAEIGFFRIFFERL